MISVYISREFNCQPNYGVLSTQQVRDQGDLVNPACPDLGQIQRLIQGLFQDVSLLPRKAQFYLKLRPPNPPD